MNYMTLMALIISRIFETIFVQLESAISKAKRNYL